MASPKPGEDEKLVHTSIPESKEALETEVAQLKEQLLTREKQLVDMLREMAEINSKIQEAFSISR